MRTMSGLIGLAAVAAISATPAAAVETPKVQIGVLVCSVAPSVGYVLGSVRDLTCELRSSRIEPYTVKGTYKGTVSRFGIDLGITSGNTLSWAVFAPTTEMGAGALSGQYVGVSANAAWAIGGWAGYRSGWIADVLRFGVVGIDVMHIIGGDHRKP